MDFLNGIEIIQEDDRIQREKNDQELNVKVFIKFWIELERRRGD